MSERHKNLFKWKIQIIITYKKFSALLKLRISQ